MTIRKSVVEYYLRNTARVILITAAAMLLIFVLTATLTVTTGGLSYSSGFEFCLYIAFMIVCMCSFKDEIHFFLQNGISRKTAFSGFVVHLLIASAACAVLEVAVNGIIQAASGGLDRYFYDNMFNVLFGSSALASGAVRGTLVHLLWSVPVFLAWGTLGYFLTNLFYRMGRMGKIFVPVGAGVLMIVLPILNSVTGGALSALWDAVMWLMLGPGPEPNPIYMLVSLLVLSLAGLGVTWLMVRRCRMKKM